MRNRDKNKVTVFRLPIILGIAIASFSSCTNSANIQDIEEPRIFQQPIIKNFAFTESKSYEWEEVKQLSPPLVSAFSLDNKSSKSLSINGFVLLDEPKVESPIEWGSTEPLAIKSDSIPLNFVKSEIKPSNVSAIGTPKPVKGFKSGLLQLGPGDELPFRVSKGMIENEDGSKWFYSDFPTDKGSLFYYTGSQIQTYDINGINAMQKDKKGRLWMIGWRTNLMVLDVEKGTLWTAPLPLSSSDLIVTENDKIWISTYNNELYIISDMTHAKKIELDNGCTDLLVSKEGSIWLSCRDRILIFNEKGTTYSSIILPQENTPMRSFRLLPDRNNNVWVSTTKGLCYVNLTNDKLVQMPIEAGFGFPAIDSYGQIWTVSNDSSISILSPDHRSIKKIKKNFKISKTGTGFFQSDAEGNIWVGSRDNGLFIWRATSPFVNYLGTEDGLSNEVVWDIFEDSKERIWIGSEAGVDMYDPSNQALYSNVNPVYPLYCSYIGELDDGQIILGVREKFSIIDESSGKVSHYSFEGVFEGLITSGILHNQSELWLTTNAGGIYKYNLETNQAYKLKLTNEIFDQTISRYITKDGMGNYWVGTNDGIMVFDPTKEQVKTLSTNEGLSHNLCTKILFMGDTAWVATLNGISILNSTDSTITTLGKAEGMQEQEIFNLIRGKDLIYAGSENGLIKIIPPKQGEQKEWKFEMLGSQFGMRYNDHHEGAGTVTSSNQIWHGVTSLEEMESKLEILQNVESIDSSVQKVVITGVQIMSSPVSFDTQEIDGEIKKVANIKKADIISTENKDILPGVSWSDTKGIYKIPSKLVIPYESSLVKFTFNNTGSFDRESMIYKYYLAGKEEVWNITARPESKYFNNLSAGKYELFVATKTIGKEWSEIESFSFEISPPWWQTWLAFLIYAILTITGIWAIVQYRSRQLKAKNRLLEETVNERTAELKASQAQLIQSEKMASLGELTAGIAHEIQNPLNFVNNFSEVSKELADELKEEAQKGEIDKALISEIAMDIADNQTKINHHGQRASSIVRAMLEHSRTSSGEKELTDINALADEYMRLAYHGLRAKDSEFNAEMVTNFDPTLPKIEVIPQDIGRVLLNLINNAFQAVDEKAKSDVKDYHPELKVTTRKLDESIEISIKDNGPGIPDSIRNKIFQPFFTTKDTGKGTGLGLSLAYDIVKVHGGEITVKSEEVTGTTFKIIIPLTKLVNGS